ncbi:MAG: TMEM175 family protein [Chitinophagaceae bacterium]
MSNQLHNELRKEFQLDRLILFSDAVFAIAITLLVIEIRIPDIHTDVSDRILLDELAHLIPRFIGFVMSFMMIGLYWTVHHRMFGFVTNFDNKLLWLNLFFLFFVALMPFSTGFYGEYSGVELFTKRLKIPMTFYVLNFCAMGLMNYFMWIRICNPKNKLADPPVDTLVAKQAKARSLVVPFIFLLMLPIAYFIGVMYAVYVPMIIPLAIMLMGRRIKKKHIDR